MDRLTLQQKLKGIGQLNLTILTGRRCGEAIEDCRREHVASGNGEATWSNIRSGLFDQGVELEQAGGDFSPADNSVTANFFERDLFDPDDGCAERAIGGDKLLCGEQVAGKDGVA